LKRSFHLAIPFDRKSLRRRPEIRHFCRFNAATNGSGLAILFGMRTKTAAHRHTGIVSFLRGVRAFVEASLVVLAFGITILLIGLPIALSVRLVHESFSWLARLGGEMGLITDAVVSIAAVVGGVILTAVFASALVGFLRQIASKSP
jgi:hypothetical protein